MQQMQKKNRSRYRPRWSFVFLAAQSQAPDSKATEPQVDEEIHARCEALIAPEGQLGP